MSGWQINERPRGTRWFYRDRVGDLVEVKRLTIPHRENSRVLCLRVERSRRTEWVEHRDLIRD